MAFSAEIGEFVAMPRRGLRLLAAFGRVAFAAILATSGTSKVVDPLPSSQFLDALLLRAGVSFPTGLILTMLLVVMELGMGACLVLFGTRRWTVLLTFGFFVGAAVVTAWAAWQGLEVGCGCLGNGFSLTPQAAAVRAAGLALGCLVLLCVQHAVVSDVCKTEIKMT